MRVQNQLPPPFPCNRFRRRRKGPQLSGHSHLHPPRLDRRPWCSQRQCFEPNRDLPVYTPAATLPLASSRRGFRPCTPRPGRRRSGAGSPGARDRRVQLTEGGHAAPFEFAAGVVAEVVVLPDENQVGAYLALRDAPFRPWPEASERTKRCRIVAPEVRAKVRQRPGPTDGLQGNEPEKTESGQFFRVTASGAAFGSQPGGIGHPGLTASPSAGRRGEGQAPGRGTPHLHAAARRR